MKNGKIKKMDVPFTQVANSVLNDQKLSWKAKGIFAYLYSKPEGWDFSGHRIKNDGSDGKASVFSAIKELEESGYLKREKKKDGKVSYSIAYKPDPENQDQGQSLIPKTLIWEIGTISNKEVSNKENTNTSEAVASQDIVSVLDEFVKINPACRSYFKNKTQRLACSDLIENYGLEKVLAVIVILPKTNLRPYLPTITTPLQLRDKWSQLEIGVVKLKNEKMNIKKPIVHRR